MIRASYNLRVQRRGKFGALFTELRSRRLKWLREIVTHQRAHRPAIAALAGRAHCERPGAFFCRTDAAEFRSRELPLT
eukprot:203707-Pyramimonas_sp.AAC.1